MSDYVIANGEVLNAEAPRSFFIPTRLERESLRPGDHAKLLFELINPGPDDPSGERMWVEVLGVEGGTFVGALSNVPAAITTIGVGDRVDFGPEHVISTLDTWTLLEKTMCVSRRTQEDDLRPSFVYREDPLSDQDSGWCALAGDETDEEVDDPTNLLVQPVGFVLDRWPELRPVLKTDPVLGEWVWDAESDRYVPFVADV